MKRSGRQRRVKVSADGRGVVSHAGAALLRELATGTGAEALSSKEVEVELWAVL